MMMWKVACLLAAPLVSFLYAAVAAVFVAAWRENPWGRHLPLVLSRLSLLAVAVAACRCVTVADDDDKDVATTTVFVATVVVLALSSWYLMVQTRLHVVLGGPRPRLDDGDMTDKVVVITGANTGIGKETARLLVRQGATVVLACRRLDKARAAKADIARDVAVADDRIHLIELDLSQLASVRRAAAQVRQLLCQLPKKNPNKNNNNKKQGERQQQQQPRRINVIINNAGVMMNRAVTTQDGYETVMQANHLGHYLWTRLLLEEYGLLSEEDGRILCLTSSTYTYAARIDLDDLFCTKGRRPFTLFGQYAQSKLANILFAKELARRATTTTGGVPLYFVATIHPGLVRTDVVRNMPWYLRYPNTVLAAVLATLQKTPRQGAWCSAYLASVPRAKETLPSGEYWVNQKVQALWPCALDGPGARQLWLDSQHYVHWQE